MTSIVKSAAAFVFGTATIIATVSAAAPASAAASTVPVRVVPGMPKAVDACNPGGFTVTTAAKLGTVTTNDTGFVYTTAAGVTSGQDSLVGHCNSDAATVITFRIAIAGKNPTPVRVTYAESCNGSAGTVVFTAVNSDTRRHTVRVASRGLTPHVVDAPVAASTAASADFKVGANGAKVAVSVNGGTPSFVELQGCPGGNGTTGVVPVKGSRTGGGFFTLHRRSASRG